jgi:hypothetical protein
MQYLDFDDVLGLTVEMLKLKGAQNAKDEEVAQVVAVLLNTMVDWAPSCVRACACDRCDHVPVCVGRWCSRVQTFSTLGGSETAAISADKLKSLFTMFDLNADQLLGSSSKGGDVVSALLFTFYIDIFMYMPTFAIHWHIAVHRSPPLSDGYFPLSSGDVVSNLLFTPFCAGLP